MHAREGHERSILRSSARKVLSNETFIFSSLKTLALRVVHMLLDRVKIDLLHSRLQSSDAHMEYNLLRTRSLPLSLAQEG